MSDTKLISLRVPIDLLAEIDLIAEAEKRSRAQVIVLKLRGDETITGVERMLEQGRAKVERAVKAGAEQKFSSVARGAGGVFGTPGVVVGSEVVPVVARPLESVEGAELNSGDALAGLGISSPVAPVYGGIKRLPSTGPQCMFCGGLNGLHQKDCQREKGKKK